MRPDTNTKGTVMAEEVRAPLAGNILSVLVEAGATVQEDDELLVIEALKMENMVYSPCGGTVREVKVKKGDKVEEDRSVRLPQRSSPSRPRARWAPSA